MPWSRFRLGRFRRLPALAGCAVAALWLAGCRTEVLRNRAENEASYVVAVLQENGVDADRVVDDREKNLWTVQVPNSQAAQAQSILKEYKLPKDEDRRYRDIFGKNTLVPTPTEQQVLSLEGLEGEVSYSLEQIPGVISARVHIVQPERDAANRPTTAAKASVLIEFQPTLDGLAPIQTSEVQTTVAGAVSGLAPENVSVVQKQAAIAQPGSGRGLEANLVALGPLVIDSSSVLPLKLAISIAIVLIAGLGWTVLWQARVLAELRREAQEKRRGQSLAPIAPRPRPGEATVA
ncbi:MAG TPA: hypothetical protein PK413_07770 [Thermoanaerobaculia bacterium]|nr:hypothetical protein [Thermoanaerobaculia bacterium]